MTYYKATRPDGTSFHDGTTKWTVGRITRHPNPDLSKGLCSSGVLHISDAPGETLVRGSWPCRLFEVEPRAALVSGDGHKHGCTAIKVQRELPAWTALGPNGEQVAAHIKRCRTLTADELNRLVAASDSAWAAAGAVAWAAARAAARSAAWDTAWAAASDSAWAAVGDTAWDTARDAALALVARDLITPEQFDTLYGPWASVMGEAGERKYMRMYRQQGIPEEITKETWLRMAEGNVHNVQVAIEHGFYTPAAHYWTSNA